MTISRSLGLLIGLVLASAAPALAFLSSPEQTR
jgi:hypothetical protein